jgi:hypothetical protein
VVSAAGGNPESASLLIREFIWVQVSSLVSCCPGLIQVDLFGVRGLPRGCQVQRVQLPLTPEHIWIA